MPEKFEKLEDKKLKLLEKQEVLAKRKRIAKRLRISIKDVQIDDGKIVVIHKGKKYTSSWEQK